MKEEHKMIRKNYSITTGLNQMVDELHETGRFASKSEVIRAAIWMLHQRVLNPQQGGTGDGKLQIQKVGTGRPAKTDKEKRAEAKMEKEEICKQLDGEVEDNKCHFYTYSLRDRFDQHVPLGHLTKTHLENQYDPSKEYVEDLQEKGKINYPLKDE